MVSAAKIAPERVLDGPLPTCKGYQQLDTTTLSTAVSLTVPNGTTIVVLQAEGAPIRWRADGVAPTASVGSLINTNTELVYPASEEAIAAIKFIRTTTGAILNAHFY